MIRLQGREPRGASYLEFAIAVTIVCLLIGVALWGMLAVSAETEKMKMEEVIAGIEQSIFSITAEHMVKHRLAELQRLENTNPMDLLLNPLPGNYAGELGNRDARPAPGSWYYNYDRQALIYRVEHRSRFVSRADHDEAVFKLRFKFADNNKNRHFDSGEEKVYGLALEPMQPYAWVDRF